MAAMLNYGIEMSKPINFGKIRELIKINIAEDVFETDTEEEQERGLKILEQMGRLRVAAAVKGVSEKRWAQKDFFCRGVFQQPANSTICRTQHLIYFFALRITCFFHIFRAGNALIKFKFLLCDI